MKKLYNTGIFSENTKLKETQTINNQLKNLYTVWFEHMRNNSLDEIGKSNEFNGMHLLTCFDSYISKKNKIMLYGKEANSQDGRVEIFDNNYQNDAYYTYDYAIANPDKTEKKQSYNRFFLKTRKLISGIENSDIPTYDKVLSILHNNLNKTSFMGKYTPCFNNKVYNGKNNKIKAINKIINEIDKTVYSDFKFNGITQNVFFHELNILKPTHLVFLCGKGYNNHIKRDFGEKFYEEVNKSINSLNVKNKPISDSVKLNKKQIQKIFGFENYDCINLIFALHPSAHMTSAIRNGYEQSLSEFINHSKQDI